MSLPVKWTTGYKKNWDEAWNRVKAWWHCEEADRPIVFSSVSKSESERKGVLITPKNPSEAALFDLDAEIKLNNIRYYLENRLFLAEAVPYAFSNYGNLLGMLCVQAGGRIQYAVDMYTAWIEQENNLYERSLPEVIAPCRALQFALDMIQCNHNTFGYDVVLGANPMLDPLTTLSLMRGSEGFLVDLIEREDDVLRWADRLGEFHRQAVTKYREVRAGLGRREEYNWTGAWSPGDMDAIQSDVSTMMSPEMFRKFVLPEMEKEASFFDYTIWHLDGTDEFKHLDDICCIPNLHAIQFVDEKRRDPAEFAHIWERILQQGKSLLFHCESSYATGLTKKLGRRGIAFYCADINTEDQMNKFLKNLAEV